MYNVHERGTIVNNRNMMQVKNKKKLFGKLHARIFLVLSEISYKLKHKKTTLQTGKQ